MYSKFNNQNTKMGPNFSLELRCEIANKLTKISKIKLYFILKYLYTISISRCHITINFKYIYFL